MNCENLNVVFAGTPEFAAVALEALLRSKHRVVGVLTQPDRPAGRGRKLTPSAVKIVAQRAAVPVFQPVNFKDPETIEHVRALQADVLVVAAYGIILPQAVLDIPALGCLNIHASLLPRWRGAAPIHRAILAGDKETGVCIMQMDAGLDTGGVLLEHRTAIEEDQTTAQLHDCLAALGATALLEALPARCSGSLVAQPQAEQGVTYAQKLSKSEAKLNFHESAEQLHRQVRAFNPWPVAESQLDGERVRIWLSSRVPETSMSTTSDLPGAIVPSSDNTIRVQTGEGQLDLLLLQRPGKKAQDALAFHQGRTLVGKRFE